MEAKKKNVTVKKLDAPTPIHSIDSAVQKLDAPTPIIHSIDSAVQKLDAPTPIHSIDSAVQKLDAPTPIHSIDSAVHGVLTNRWPAGALFEFPEPAVHTERTTLTRCDHAGDAKFATEILYFVGISWFFSKLHTCEFPAHEFEFNKLNF